MDFAGVYGVSGQRFGSKVEFDDMDPASEKNRTMIDTPWGPYYQMSRGHAGLSQHALVDSL